MSSSQSITKAKRVTQYISHDQLMYLARGPIPFAGEVFDEPEEGNEIQIGDDVYVYTAHEYQCQRGTERWGWYLDGMPPSADAVALDIAGNAL